MKIEKSVPIPEALAAKGRPTAWPLDAMNPGDSFVFQAASIKALKAAIWRRKARYNEQFAIGMHNNKWRCWRVS